MIRRHLRALPLLRGLWRTVEIDGHPRWIVPADPESESQRIPHLMLRPGHPGVRLQVVAA